MKPYKTYRCSGVEWLGEIPERWGAVQVKRNFEIQLGKMLQNKPDSDADISVPYIKALHVRWGKVDTSDLPDMWASPAELKQFGVKSGDLLVCEGGEGGRAGILYSTPELCIIQNALHRVRGKGADVHFLQYVLQAVSSGGWFDVLCNKATIAHFTREKLAELRMPLPPSLEEQRAISAFLDRETVRIDGLIEKKEQQIELLREKRSALISHAVTKGLNPTAKMKPSGVEWLGDIPEHWEIKRFKYALWLQRGHDLPSTDFHDGSYPVLGSNGCIGYHDQFTTKGPGVTIGRSGSVGEVNYVETDYWAHNTALYIKEYRRSIPRYAYFLLKTLDVKYLSEGTAVGTLNRNYIHDLPIAIPHVAEQHAIAAFLDRETVRIDWLIEKVRESIEKLREYRSAVISAAVTGKIYVRSGLKIVERHAQRQAPPEFKRAVLGAEIVHELHKEPTFGRVKFEKIIYLCENHLGIDLDGNFQRQAAGPLDNRMLRSIESQIEKAKWYKPVKDGSRIQYVPLAKAGDHLKYFDRYWSDMRDQISGIIELLRSLNTERVEIVATLFAAWNDLVLQGARFTDKDIIKDVRENWHESKNRFDEDRLQKALDWMREKGLIPRGKGRLTHARGGK